MKYIGFVIFMYLTTAWEFMLAIGVAHLHWWQQIPPIGFTTSLVITFLLFSMLTGGTATTFALAKGWLK